MNYSDENLYQQLFALAHSLRHSHGHRQAGFPHRHRPETPDSHSENTKPFSNSCGSPDPREHLFFSGSFPDMREGCMRRKHEHAHGRHERPGEGRFPSFDDRRPPLARERILRLIGEMEPVSQTMLAEHLAIRPQSLSEQLAKLENDGLLLRAASEQDKRVTLVSLTDQGRQRAQEVEAARAQQSSAFLSPLSQAEREQLFLLLQKLLNRA